MMLEQEEANVDAEQEALKLETENIKLHNKALFERISANQTSLGLSQSEQD